MSNRPSLPKNADLSEYPLPPKKGKYDPKKVKRELLEHIQKMGNDENSNKKDK